MKKIAIYTKAGDKGTTGLVGGTRIKKSDPRIHLYGEVDELNSFIGFAMSQLDGNTSRELLLMIQSALFDLGSNLACERDQRSKIKLPQLTDDLIEKLEDAIDEMDTNLPILKNFVLPGGISSAASFHICRTVCRRLERQMVDFEEQHPGEVPEKGLVFINRLSDYFFILSRYLNAEKNTEERLWVPKV